MLREAAGVDANDNLYFDTYSYSFTYNKDGIRTSKTVNGVVHEYILNGSQILAEQWQIGSTEYFLVYLYDETGSPIGLKYRTSAYAEVSGFDSFFFEKNLKGDIVAIYNESGTKIGSYTYDAWGNHTYTTASGTTGLERKIVSTYNPFRYRGYFYDVETQWYYLQSRYYNPNWGRFINADIYVNANGDLLGYNMFAYCNNNPVMGYDPLGEWNWGTFFGGVDLLTVGITAIAVSATILTCGAAAPAMVAVAAVTMTAGVLTTVNGASEVVEAATGYNVVEEVVFQGNEEAYETYRNGTKLVAEVGTAICGTYYSAKGGNVCSVAGTMIASATGQVPIEEIKAGDWVWATNPDTGETELKQVVQTFRNETTELVHITVNGEEIVCTNEHPFYSPVRGWIAACQLRAGDILVQLNGEYVVVEKVQHEILEHPIAVYNFEVEGFHSYHVGEQSLLVHNRCAGYEAPNSGGGVSDTINMGDTTVTFGHGGRHLDPSINVSNVNSAIAKDVVTKNLNLGDTVKMFDITVEGVNLQYRAKKITDSLINVGTYYVK